ncbi:DegT/DnrJ/EryC1/StrS family aminotransferase [Chryseobacterium takakiae]|uniref:dTDP-4-amino-4,6-dideoxygalactose transaminase n=1 Tax=Chryseobacterium takakiae TaxID=1302685 RepID=A0A1M4VM88_9FLAO|nr:DegT/DnrJ/EryC1/StrS family aminotransferase [Chryseobacterium takakiae]SHE69963.1 dTDP-4-amino-4,6-dideoxygalactose transaminase [Chryseobacterium takakiae]
MIFYKEQIIYPESFRQPSFFISPFSTADLEKNAMIVKDCSCNENTIKKYNSFFGKHEYFLSGKEAINKALSHYLLQKEDEVLILTTTANSYVSSCVTKEIEKFCTWSRQKTDKTKVVFIIHEFGKIYNDMETVKKFNLPIIEDCAMSMFSNDENNLIGTHGDFTIYSIPKFFPVQFGGILKINCENYSITHTKIYKDYLQKLVLHYFQDTEHIINQRKNNNCYMIAGLTKLGFTSYFEYSEFETPSVCMFENNGCDIVKLKVFLQQHGIECSVFYGKDAFFLPVHQALGVFEMDYILNLIEFFIHENK